MSLNSVVSSLVRAAAGIPIDISDADLDEHVARLLAEEAKASEVKWSELGLGGLLGSTGRDTPDVNAPKPNKRFLASIIRNVDGHNSALLREQARAANDARRTFASNDPDARYRDRERDDRDRDRDRGESSRRSTRPSGSGGASRLFGGAMKSLGRDERDVRSRDSSEIRRRREEIKVEREKDAKDGEREYRYDWSTTTMGKSRRRSRDEEVGREGESSKRRSGMYGHSDEESSTRHRSRRHRDKEETGEDEEEMALNSSKRNRDGLRRKERDGRSRTDRDGNDDERGGDVEGKDNRRERRRREREARDREEKDEHDDEASSRGGKREEGSHNKSSLRREKEDPKLRHNEKDHHDSERKRREDRDQGDHTSKSDESTWSKNQRRRRKSSLHFDDPLPESSSRSKPAVLDESPQLRGTKAKRSPASHESDVDDAKRRKLYGEDEPDSDRRGRRGGYSGDDCGDRRGKRRRDSPDVTPRRSRTDETLGILGSDTECNGSSASTTTGLKILRHSQISKDSPMPPNPISAQPTTRVPSPLKESIPVPPPSPPPPPPPADMPPSPPPPSPPPVSLSKMDRYFDKSYDPRLDLGEIPKEGMVVSVGWDNMLAVLKDRGRKPRRSPSPPPPRSAPPPLPTSYAPRPPPRSPSSETVARRAARKARKARLAEEDSEDEKDRQRRRERKKKEKEKLANLGKSQRVGVTGEGKEGEVGGYAYVPKGGIREWDLGK